MVKYTMQVKHVECDDTGAKWMHCDTRWKAHGERLVTGMQGIVGKMKTRETELD